MVSNEWERVCLERRKHAVVLAGPFARALGLAAVGIGLMAIGWPASIPGVALQALGATVAVRLSGLGAVEIEQGLLGRLLGYGTIVAGELEIDFVPEPRRVYGLVERLCS